MDAFTEFLATRDPEKVLAERVISLEALYEEAPNKVRDVIDIMPIGVLRRKLAEAEAALQVLRQREPRTVIQHVGDRVLMKALRDANAQIRQLTERNERQARRIAELRKKLERKRK